MSEYVCLVEPATLVGTELFPTHTIHPIMTRDNWVLDREGNRGLFRLVQPGDTKWFPSVRLYRIEYQQSINLFSEVQSVATEDLSSWFVCYDAHIQFMQGKTLPICRILLGLDIFGM